MLHLSASRRFDLNINPAITMEKQISILCTSALSLSLPRLLRPSIHCYTPPSYRAVCLWESTVKSVINLDYQLVGAPQLPTFDKFALHPEG